MSQCRYAARTGPLSPVTEWHGPVVDPIPRAARRAACDPTTAAAPLGGQLGLPAEPRARTNASAVVPGRKVEGARQMD